ncbi:MAG: GNAT family N-acetyltransferase [Candidatus Hodarchaeales archaeon]|jgi:GNAT superfamily N-acetyltransferase
MKFSSYKQGDEKFIVDFLELIFEGWPNKDLDCIPIEHWNWKYLDNPTGLLNVNLAWKENELVGCDHVSYNRVKLGEKILISGIWADTAVHPDHRRKGISNTISDNTDSIFLQHNGKFAYWYTTNPIFIEQAKRQERVIFPHQIMNMMRIKDIKLHLRETNSKNRFVKEIGYNIISKLSLMKKKFKQNTSKKLEHTRIREINYFDGGINAFLHGIEDHFSFIVKRDQDYLNYRYNDSRAGKYKVRILENDIDILGYIVSGTKVKNGYETGFIVDLLSKPFRIDVAEKLLGEALEQFDDEGINVVKSWVLQNHPYDQLFRNNGFLNVMTSPPFIEFHIYSVENEWNIFSESRPENVHFSMGDLDVI